MMTIYERWASHVRLWDIRFIVAVERMPWIEINVYFDSCNSTGTVVDRGSLGSQLQRACWFSFDASPTVRSCTPDISV